MELALYVIILNNSFNQHGDFLQFYSIFHINTSFSSIEKKDLKKVINKCYWPLLKLAENSDYKISIESSGVSLEEINKIDSFLIKKLKTLIKNKKVEFIGSGYCQAIFPLIPYEVNNMNLKIGNEIYKKLLGLKPKVALVHEQIFSESLIPIFKNNGYESIIIDWKNCKLANNNLDNNLQFFPQLMKYKKHKINIIWSNSLNFQKFQNYIHGEINKDTFFNFINFISKKNRNFCLYSNDVEVFNYRPGRFSNETKLNKYNEWDLIENVYQKILRKNRFLFISDLLKIKNKKKEIIKIFSSKVPIITKKQPKYNIIRWSLAGRDNLYINTLCYKIYKYLKNNQIYDKKIWKKICYFWSSDYRTHITQKRWNSYIKNILGFTKKFKINDYNNKLEKNFIFNNLRKKSKIEILKVKNLIKISDKNNEILINTRKGLTIESYKDYRISQLPIIGKIEKGFFNQIDHDVDFFSAFFQLYDRVNNKKITELSSKVTNYKIHENNFLSIKNIFKFNNFKYEKILIFDLLKGRYGIKNKFINFPIGFLRFNYLTLNPNNFNFKKLYFETKNGGSELEKFNLNNMDFDHGEHVSTLCSATTGLGTTDGTLIIGDNKKTIKITNENEYSNLISMIKNKKILKKNLFRFYQSGMEYDDTSKSIRKKKIESLTWFNFLN